MYMQSQQNNTIMTSKDLLQSFRKQAKPYVGDEYSKWLTVKQINFLYSLLRREDEEGADYYMSGSKMNFDYNGQKHFATLRRTAPNGCRVITFKVNNIEATQS